MKQYTVDFLYNPRALTTQFVINKYGEKSIYEHFLGHPFIDGKVFSSPFRTDTIPSFCIHKNRTGRYRFKDFGTGDEGGVLDFIKMLYPGMRSNKAILSLIHATFTSGKVVYYPEVDNTSKELKRASIGINRGKFTKDDLNYWNQYGISKEILSLYEVYHTERVFMNDTILWTYEDINPIYSYYVYDHLKIYRPKADKRNKWLGNLTRYDIFGYCQLPEKGDLLIITKSAKDVMCLISMGYIAIAPSSETTLIPESIINILKERFTKILVFYDNDSAGKKMANRICEKYDLSSFIISEEDEVKDITDYYVKYGRDHTMLFLKRYAK